MDVASKRWDVFTEQRPPDDLLQEAIKLVQEKEAALDMGAGALNETKYLLGEGFGKIVILDVEPGIVERAEELGEKERLEVVVSRFEDYTFPPDTFDLINARYSLPFVSPESFERVFLKAKASLKPGGILVTQLFGSNDYRNKRKDMTLHSRREVEQLLSDMEILELREEEYDGPTYNQGIQHWHVFTALARK